MTFGNFLLFLFIPLLFLLWHERRRLRTNFLVPIGVVALGSIFYTAPWDHRLIADKIWWFDPERSWNIRIGALPLEELLFYLLIIALAAMWTHFLYHKMSPSFGLTPKRPNLRFSLLGFFAGLWAINLVYLAFGTQSYPKGIFWGQCLTIILPMIAIQCAICGDLFWHRRKFITTAAILFGLYLTLTAGTQTFGKDIWIVYPQYSLWRIPGMLPIEMPFFYCFAGLLAILPASTLLDFDKEYFRSWSERINIVRFALLGKQT